MKKLLGLFAVGLLASSAFAQKGVDKQTKTINQESGRTIQSSTESSKTSGGRVLSFGKGKTIVRERLANPYKIASRRDILVNSLIDILKERKIIIDESASRLSEGVIITQPFVFAKGTVISSTELNRFAVLPSSGSVWKSGRCTLRIDVESIDGMQNNVGITAKIEGKAENGLISEWTTLQSSGEIEDEILAKLVEYVTGTSVEPVQPEEKPADVKKPDNNF